MLFKLCYEDYSALLGCNILQLPVIKAINRFIESIPKKQNPTSQNEKRDPGIQLMATSILGWRIVYLNSIDNPVSDLIIVGQTLFCDLE